VSEQTYRIEVRFDFTGTQQQAEIEAQRVASLCGGEVTEIWDENWDEITADRKES
jgi:hypothetical protein